MPTTTNAAPRIDDRSIDAPPIPTGKGMAINVSLRWDDRRKHFRCLMIPVTPTPDGYTWECFAPNAAFTLPATSTRYNEKHLLAAYQTLQARPEYLPTLSKVLAANGLTLKEE